MGRQGILVTPVDPTDLALHEVARHGTPVVIVDRVGDATRTRTARSRSTTSLAHDWLSSTSWTSGTTGGVVAIETEALTVPKDLLALGLLQQCVSLGIRVPEDLAIVGYDDIDFAAAAAVPLISVRQPAGTSVVPRPSC